MRIRAASFGLLSLMLGVTLSAGAVAPASAEFFGCKTPHTTVSYSSRPFYSPAPRVRTTTRYTHEFAAQRSRHVTYSSRWSHRRQYDRW
jgi:hypothetical protein